MHLRSAAVAACALLTVASGRGWASATPFTLDDAVERVLATHPDLRRYEYQAVARAARIEEAALTPPLALNADVENALGTGSVSGLDAAEFTLSLASVLEPSGKRDGRRAVATGWHAALATERDATRLDLLAEVARRYLDIVAAAQRAAIASDEIALRQRVVEAASTRIAEGASPVSVRLIGEAVKARAEIDLARARSQQLAAWRDLAILWGDGDDTVVPQLAGDPLSLPRIDALAALLAQIDTTPAVLRFNDAARIRDAQLQLARAQSRPDVTWRVGVRRLEAEDDFGLVAGVAVPFGSGHRAGPAIRAAQGEIDALEAERESVLLELRSTLILAHGRYTASRAESDSITAELLPRLEAAAAAAERAYRAGSASYLEWTDVLSEIVTARIGRLAAAIEAQLALIEIQRLTGEAHLVAPAVTEESAR